MTTTSTNSSSEEETTPSSWLLFGVDSDSDESVQFIANPIPIVTVTTEYVDVVGIFVNDDISDDIANNKTPTLASSVKMAGCGASVELLQYNHRGIAGTGGVVWGAAPALCTVLASTANYTNNANFDALDLSNKLVLELGSGTGALGLWVSTKWPSATVILSDLPEAQKMLRANIAKNGLGDRCIAAELIFGEDVPTSFIVAALPPSVGLGPSRCIDVIVASDCQFSKGAEFIWEPFIATIRSASPETQVWISIQERYGVRAETLEPFLCALKDLAGSRSQSLADSNAEEEGVCSFVEIVHPELGIGSHFQDAEYPNRCMYLSL